MNVTLELGRFNSEVELGYAGLVEPMIKTMHVKVQREQQSNVTIELGRFLFMKIQFQRAEVVLNLSY